MGTRIEMNEEQLMEHLRHAVYVRAMPTPNGGVGVFAIRDIPEGTNPFGEDGITYLPIPVDAIFDDPEIPDTVKKYVKDMCAREGGLFYIPSCGLNNIGPSYYVNHSRTPNLVTPDKGENFIICRQVKAGEELTIDYRTYSDEN